MNTNINYANFLELMLFSDDEFESYGLIPVAQQTSYTEFQTNHLKPRSPYRIEEPDTWYGE